ncbi:MAG: 8-oxoguanine deaminase [Caldiserica bacterium]|nr:8-oxoguanine deaminase [Caldisericota bacterium]MDH7563065.1 8-oxoguanine deaminase [Caldisericota bacterium]
MEILIKNAYRIITWTEDGLKSFSGDILIEGRVIKKIGKDLNSSSAKIIPGEGKIVIPGLVNTHHHLYQTFQRNLPLTQDSELFPWLKTLYQIWRYLDPEIVYWSALLGMAELLKTGCTTTTDQFYVFPRGAPKDLIDAEIEAGKKIGIRFQPCRGSMSLGESKGGLPPDDVVQDEEEILEDCERLISRYHDPSPFSMLRISLAPCSPFSVSRELLILSQELARKHGVRLHTHLAETKDEEDFCLEKFGMRPLEYLERTGWFGPDVWYAHCIYLNDEELRRIKEAGSKVAHCPTSNMRLGSGVAPIPKMLKMGIEVGLAVDGSASNDSSDMLGELRNCLLVHKLTCGVTSISAAQILQMATVGGARVLGFEEIGTIEPGKAADLVLIDANQIGYAGALSDPLGALIYAGDSHIVDTTIVNGEILVEKGRIVKADEDEIINRANELSRKMLQKAEANSVL